MTQSLVGFSLFLHIYHSCADLQIAICDNFQKKKTFWENFSFCFFFASFCSHIVILSSLACFAYWQKTLSPVHSSSQTETGFKMLSIRKLFCYVDWTKATPENVKPITDFCYFLVKKIHYPHQNQSISHSKIGIYSNLNDQCTKSRNEVIWILLLT